jgi:hypothetical protein
MHWPGRVWEWYHAMEWLLDLTGSCGHHACSWCGNVCIVYANNWRLSVVFRVFVLWIYI